MLFVESHGTVIDPTCSLDSIPVPVSEVFVCWELVIYLQLKCVKKTCWMVELPRVWSPGGFSARRRGWWLRERRGVLLSNVAMHHGMDTDRQGV